MGKLTGKKAIVTGASRGIGLAIATKLASEGADVAILSTSVKEDLAAKLSAELGVQVKSYASRLLPTWARSISWSTTPVLPVTAS